MANLERWVFGYTARLQLDVHGEACDLCEHVTADRSLLYACGCEDDSFGPVGRWCCCRTCYEAAHAAEQEETHCCNDCKQWVPKKAGFEWRWYDFYAAQGDEPLFICNECAVKETHQTRVKCDSAERAAEAALADEEDCGQYDDDSYDGPESTGG